MLLEFYTLENDNEKYIDSLEVSDSLNDYQVEDKYLNFVTNYLRANYITYHYLRFWGQLESDRGVKIDYGSWHKFIVVKKKG